MYYSTNYVSPIGSLTLVSDGENIVGLWMEGQKYFGGAIREKMTAKEDLPVLALAKNWLDKYFAGENPSLAGLPLAPAGSDFRQSVWEILQTIPYGEVVTYGDIAKRMAAKTGRPGMSGQAVGGAVGHNPISVLIPCHRVVGSNGSLTGFSGGIKKKIKLLEHEGVDMSRLFVPKKGTAL